VGLKRVRCPYLGRTATSHRRPRPRPRSAIRSLLHASPAWEEKGRGHAAARPPGRSFPLPRRPSPPSSCASAGELGLTSVRPWDWMREETEKRMRRSRRRRGCCRRRGSRILEGRGSLCSVRGVWHPVSRAEEPIRTVAQIGSEILYAAR
jgi:hypothetical protein